MRRKYWILLIICIFVFASDQYTKHLVQKSLPRHHRIEVIEGFFNLTHVRNTGGAFGILGGKRGGWGTLFFVGISILAVGSILYFLWRMKKGEENLTFSLSLVLAGALGNLYDRIRYGEVIDFLEFYVSSFYWPAFNIADSAICLGIGLMAFELLILDHQKKKAFKTARPK